MSQFQHKFWENCIIANTANYISPEEFFYGYMASAVINIIQALLAVSLNTITIVVFYKANRLKVMTDIFMCSLAVTDILVGLLSMTTLATQSLVRAYEKHVACEFLLVGRLTRILCMLLTVMTTTLLSLDRYAAIFQPYRYERFREDRKFTIKILAGLWGTCILLAIGSLGTTNLSLLLIPANICLATSLPFSIWVHLRAFFVARRISRQIQGQVAQVQGEDERRRTKQDIKAARLTAIIIGVVFICYLPLLVIGTILNIFGESVTIIKAFIWAYAIIMANSVFNPLVYVWQMKWFRKAFKKVIFMRDVQRGYDG